MKSMGFLLAEEREYNGYIQTILRRFSLSGSMVYAKVHILYAAIFSNITIRKQMLDVKLESVFHFQKHG
jgi:ribosomal protein S19